MNRANNRAASPEHLVQDRSESGWDTWTTGASQECPRHAEAPGHSASSTAQGGIHLPCISEKGSHQVDAFLQMGQGIPINFPPETSFKIHNIQTLHISPLSLPPRQQPSRMRGSVCSKALTPGRAQEFLKEEQAHPFIRNEILSSSSSLLPSEHFPSEGGRPEK